MIVIADSSSTRTQWAMVNGSEVVETAVTAGLNPFFRTRREISHIIRLELPDVFFHSKVEEVYVYGAGCANESKCKVVEGSVVAQFRAPAHVESDLVGAARGLLGREGGLVSILSTGSNSCYYDGERIVKSVATGGYVLGDEGSNAYLGKLLLSDVLKGLAPSDVAARFYAWAGKTVSEIMDEVYTQPNPNLALARYGAFLAEIIERPYCRQMVYDAFMAFFRRNISAYDYEHNALSAVGRTCCAYQDIFRQAAADFGVKINKIEASSMPGLIQYHSK